MQCTIFQGAVKRVQLASSSLFPLHGIHRILSALTVCTIPQVMRRYPPPSLLPLEVGSTKWNVFALQECGWSYRVKGENRDIHQAAYIIHPQKYNSNGPWKTEKHWLCQKCKLHLSCISSIASEHRHMLLNNAPMLLPHDWTTLDGSSSTLGVLRTRCRQCCPRGTALWVGRALHVHAKPITVSALSVNLQPSTAWADAWIAAVDWTAMQLGLKLCGWYVYWMQLHTKYHRSGDAFLCKQLLCPCTSIYVGTYRTL